MVDLGGIRKVKAKITTQSGSYIIDEERQLCGSRYE